jgi:3-oxoacyl-[acyl-carrier protein] reductase
MEARRVSATASAEQPVALVLGASGGLGTRVLAEFQSQHWRATGTRHIAPPQTAGDAAAALLPLDVRDGGAVEALFDQLAAQTGRLDCVVNCTGVCHDALLPRASEADWDETLAVNLTGAMLCTRAAARVMRRTGGHILHVGSFVARHGRAGQSAYAASKAALLGFAQSAAAEYGRRDIRINVVLPGILPTRMTAGLDPAHLDALTRENVLARFSTPDEIARCIVFLAGTRHISGQVFQLDSRPVRWC